MTGKALRERALLSPLIKLRLCKIKANDVAH
jgi:hypothetical protein